MIELKNQNCKIKRLSKITFIGLFNSFESVFSKLLKLKEQGSIDILEVRKDLIEARDRLLQIQLVIDTILHSYENGYGIEEEGMKCDFCPDQANKYQSFHKWCSDCFNREFGGEIAK